LYALLMLPFVPHSPPISFTLFDHSNNICSRAPSKVLIWSILHAPITYSVSCPDILASTKFSNTVKRKVELINGKIKEFRAELIRPNFLLHTFLVLLIY
jgi:hypothetical protein